MTRILALNSYHCFYSDFTSLQKIGHCSWSWLKKGYLNVFQLLCLVVCKDKTRTVMSVFFNYVVLCVVMMSWCWLGDLEENLSCPLTSSFSASTYDPATAAGRIFDNSIPTQEEILNWNYVLRLSFFWWRNWWSMMSTLNLLKIHWTLLKKLDSPISNWILHHFTVISNFPYLIFSYLMFLFFILS